MNMRWFSWRAGAIVGAIVLCLSAMPATAASSGSDALMASAASMGAGQFAWDEQVAATGRVNIVISIPLQQLFVYKGADLIAVSAVSTGKEGHETPVGQFTILQKDVNHHSNKYDDAPMPYMERLTWDGVAIHGGRDPGYPASHGCVRVPLAFAKKLYAITALGAHVSIVDDATAPGLPDDYARAPVSPPVATPVESSEVERSLTRAANLAQVY
jgi:lipoprotein-anchoring transpeptidase ErfK/SrfK